MSHDAFHRAFDDAKPGQAKVPGLQEFAAAIWDRRRIPSRQDPLIHIFDEVGGEPAAASVESGHPSPSHHLDHAV